MFVGNRRYYYENSILIDHGVIKRTVNSSNSIDQIGEILENMGITHIMVRYDLFRNWTKHNLSPEKQTLLNTFFSNRAKQIKSYGGYGLFELI
jgi:hypothetical protein